MTEEYKKRRFHEMYEEMDEYLNSHHHADTHQEREEQERTIEKIEMLCDIM